MVVGWSLHAGDVTQPRLNSLMLDEEFHEFGLRTSVFANHLNELESLFGRQPHDVLVDLFVDGLSRRSIVALKIYQIDLEFTAPEVRLT